MRPILNARGPAAVQLRREPTRGSGVERDAWILAIDELAVFPTERLTLGRDTDTVPAEIAEPRREASYGEWSTRACREILQLLPFASLEVVSCGGRWEMRVFQGAQSEMIVGFRSDGSWVEPTSPRVKRWSEVLEGGPEEVGRHVARPHARLRHGPDVGREGVTDAATVSGPGEEAL